jgi:predicted regulator of Ras-like GTPase activity (Roadblock/LC7/MglB family)
MRRIDESKPGRREIGGKLAKTQREISQILDKLTALKGVILTTVFDPEGFPVASQINASSPRQYGIQELTPIISGLIKQVDSIGQDLKIRQPKSISLEFDEGILKVNKVQDRKEYLVILAENKINIGVLTLEAKKNLRKLSKILEE